MDPGVIKDFLLEFKRIIQKNQENRFLKNQIICFTIHVIKRLRKLAPPFSSQKTGEVSPSQNKKVLELDPSNKELLARMYRQGGIWWQPGSLESKAEGYLSYRPT